ncbi:MULTISPECIES: hypothetical protein [Cyanophyceae]|nr:MULTISPECIES: hypothetical protein [unclassified Picosynechococcus]
MIKILQKIVVNFGLEIFYILMIWAIASIHFQRIYCHLNIGKIIDHFF